MSGRLVSPTFVGRREALRAAADLVDEIERGRVRTLLVGGEAGIGKTRFAEAVTEQATAAGLLVVAGVSVRLETGELPYAPIVGILGQMKRALGEARLATVLGGDAPILLRIASGGKASRGRQQVSESPEAARARLFKALLESFCRLASRQPTLIVVEDLQWADAASLDTIAFLIRSLRKERIGLLLTFRSDELHRRHPLRAWLGEVERADAVERFELEPFTRGETQDLIAAVRGHVPADPLVDAVQARSDGNPFFIEELLAQDVESGCATLPSSLCDVLQARVEGIPDEAQPILKATAVAGRRVDTALLVEVTDLSSGTFDRGLQAAVERGVLLREPDPAGEQVAFRHALIQEVVFDSVLPGERIRLHRRIAEALARRLARGRPGGPGRWAELAMHWDGARDEPRAFDAALHAAAEAAHAYAFNAALAQYRRALAAWEVVAEPSAVAGFDHIELLSRAAEAAWLSGQDQVALLREAISEADTRADAGRGALLRGRLGYALWVSGEPLEARGVYQEAVARLPFGPATPERAWILARLAQALMLEGGYRESLRLAEAALQQAREAGNLLVEAHCLNTLASAEGELGVGSRAVETIERALALALELGVPDEVGRAYLNASEILATCGLDHRALELVWQGIDRTAAMGLQLAYGGLIAVHGAAIAFDLGRWGEAGELGASMVDTELDPNTEVYVLARTVLLPVAMGRWKSAHAKLGRMRELLERFAVEAQYTGPCASAEAELALWEGRPDDALAAAEWGLSRLARTDDVRHRARLCRLGLRATADVAGLARDHRDAAADAAAVATGVRLRDLLEAATTATAMDGGLAALAVAEMATAVAEEARLRGSCIPDLWREAAARWLVRERPYERAYAGWRESEAHLLAGDRCGAVEPLRTALEIARRLGAEPLRKEIVALARRARISVEAAPPAVASEPASDRKRLLAEEFGLTRREVDVLELLAEGMTNRQIAKTLFISVYTAGVHVSRILAKLDATSRTEAASKAYRLGMVRS